jgi:hypothetical protein
MTQLPSILKRGERARLFPVLADTSKEGRTLSIFLSCFQNVEEFGRSLLSSIDIKTGARSRVECFTEVGLLKCNGMENLRPDGLIVVTSGTKIWTALIEAKVGNADLTAEQIDNYVELAKLNGVDALITLSNQFAPLPSHHPVPVLSAARKKIALFHWSWMYVVTEATLLLNNDDVADREQRVILQEMNRFLLHPSSGVKSFEQMPGAWTDIVSKVQAGGSVSAGSPDAREVVGAWHQVVRHLSYNLSRQLSTDVEVRMSRAQAADPALRQKEALQGLAGDAQLSTVLIVPNAAADIRIVADLKKRTVALSMKLRAPDDIKSTKARANWLVRQLQKSDGKNVHVRLCWPGKSADTQFRLEELRNDAALASTDRDGQTVLSFEVLMVKDLAGRFAQRRNFVGDLEQVLPDFYEQVAQHLKAWQAKAPKLPADKAEPADVSVEAMREDLEAEALLPAV